jgi:AcrR family transcriptional regulator
MGIQERKIRQKEEVRANILQASWQTVLEEGWQALSIRKIADAIEYSVPVIYSHFENKDAILLEFTREGFQKLSVELQKAKDSKKDPCAQLEAMARAYWNFAFSEKEFYQLMFGLGIPTCDKLNQVEEIRALSQVMISSIEKAIETGNNPGADKHLKFRTYWSILHGLVSIQKMDNDSTAANMQQMILKDAVAGFIKSLRE